jgi:DNA-binding CsgD family transcriptional regulator
MILVSRRGSMVAMVPCLRALATTNLRGRDHEDRRIVARQISCQTSASRFRVNVTVNALGEWAPVFERDEELRTADSALRIAEDGTGSVVLLEGQAGIGKTSLLSTIARRAQRRGLRCMGATAGERERELEWTVVRGLLASVVAGMSAASRAELAQGPARLALSLLAYRDVAVGRADPGALLYGLYWLVVELALESPVFLSVDDAHWADEASLRWLEYLSARITDVGIVLAVSRRTDGAPVQLQALAAHGSCLVLRPAPLSRRGCAAVLASALGRDPDEAFAEACRELTGGNPFLLHALARWLRETHVEPVLAQVPRLADARPGEVETWTMLRLEGLPAPALEVARATAILGGQATLGRVALMTGTSLRELAETAATLHRVGILDDEGELSTFHPAAVGQVRFAHPLLRTVVYESIPAFLRTALHTQAARQLQDERAPAAAVAQQLMFTEPRGESSVVAVLRAAASEAVASGAPAIAAARLTRALAEPPEQVELAAVLHELGSAEGAAALPEALEHLERAYAEARSPAQRGLIAEDLALSLTCHGRLKDSAGLVKAALSELHDEAGALKGDQMLRLGALYITTSSYLRRGSEARAWLASLGAAPAAATPGERLLLVAYSQEAITRGESAASAGELAERAVDGGRLLADVGPASSEMWSAVSALIIGCRYTAAEEAIDAAAEAAQKRGSSYGYAMALCFGGLLAYRRGRLTQTVTDERQAMAILEGEPVAVIRDYAAAFLAHALIDTGDLDVAARMLDALSLDDAPPLAPYAIAVAARGRLRLIRDDPEGALSDLRRVESLAGMERLTPAVWPWRGEAALALLALHRRPEAAQLAAQEVELAQRSGSAWAEGLALHAAGVVASGAEGSALLERAADRLQSVDASSEHARVLIDLGSMADAAGASSERALGWLRRGLDLADRCGAGLLAEQAHAALVSRGARPRRRRLSGAEALTPMERRVAERAAAGMSNREIAQDLFVTLRTVESHLTSGYRKLQIESRAGLANALHS